MADREASDGPRARRRLSRSRSVSRGRTRRRAHSPSESAPSSRASTPASFAPSVPESVHSAASDGNRENIPAGGGTHVTAAPGSAPPRHPSQQLERSESDPRLRRRTSRSKSRPRGSAPELQVVVATKSSSDALLPSTTELSARATRRSGAASAKERGKRNNVSQRSLVDARPLHQNQEPGASAQPPLPPPPKSASQASVGSLASPRKINKSQTGIDRSTVQPGGVQFSAEALADAVKLAATSSAPGTPTTPRKKAKKKKRTDIPHPIDTSPNRHGGIETTALLEVKKGKKSKKLKKSPKAKSHDKPWPIRLRSPTRQEHIVLDVEDIQPSRRGRSASRHSLASRNGLLREHHRENDSECSSDEPDPFVTYSPSRAVADEFGAAATSGYSAKGAMSNMAYPREGSHKEGTFGTRDGDPSVVFVEEGKRFRRYTASGISAGPVTGGVSFPFKSVAQGDSSMSSPPPPPTPTTLLDVVTGFERVVSFTVFLGNALLGGMSVLALVLLPTSIPSTVDDAARFAGYYAPLANATNRVFYAMATLAMCNALNLHVRRDACEGEMTKGSATVTHGVDSGQRSGQTPGQLTRQNYMQMALQRRRKIIGRCAVLSVLTLYIVVVVLVPHDDRLWFSTVSNSGVYSTALASSATSDDQQPLLDALEVWVPLHLARCYIGIVSWMLVMYQRHVVRQAAGKKASLVNVGHGKRASAVVP